MKKIEIDKKLNRLSSKEEQLKKEKQKLLYQMNKEFTKKERRKRTHRIATKGALLEKYFDCEEYSIDDTELLLKTFASFVKENKPNILKEKYNHDRN